LSQEPLIRITFLRLWKRRRDYTRLKTNRPFYLPEQAVPLPDGNAALTRAEADHQKYREQRILEAEAFGSDEKEGSSQMSKQVSDDDPVLARTRDRLEALYQSPGAEEAENDPPIEQEVVDSKMLGG
jgi:hypothetical protein